MEIVKYNKIKANTYDLNLDNGSVLSLYDETIIKFDLLLNKTIDNNKLSQVTSYNDDLDAYYLALKYIGKKMRSELEVEKYLLKKEFSNERVTKAISLLKEKGYLNNEKYITSYINDQIKLTNNGPDKIKANLIKLGINELEIIIDYDFSEKMGKLINKKINMNKKSSSFTLKQNISNYLINLGYNKESFIEIIENIKVDDSSLIRKEYELLVRKYKNKYDNPKLKLFIRDKLYRKGYNIEDINEVINDGDVY